MIYIEAIYDFNKYYTRSSVFNIIYYDLNKRKNDYKISFKVYL